jgi:hypothetical protein
MKSGIDKTRMSTNILMLVLVVINIFFGIQYTQNIGFEDKIIEEQAQKTEARIQVAKFLRLFVEKVLSTNGTVSFEDRVQLENDVRKLGDDQIVKQWQSFVSSKDGEEAQQRAILLMSLLSNKMVN